MDDRVARHIMATDPETETDDEIDEWFRTVEGAIVSIDATNEIDDCPDDVAAILDGLSCMGADIHNGLITFHGLLDVAGDDVPPTPPGAVRVTFLLDRVCE